MKEESMTEVDRVWAQVKYAADSAAIETRSRPGVSLAKVVEAGVKAALDAALTQGMLTITPKGRWNEMTRRRGTWRKPPTQQVTAKRYPEAAEVIESGLSRRTYSALVRGGYITLDQVETASLEELLDVRGVGTQALREIVEVMTAKGRSLDPLVLRFMEES